MKKLLFRGVTLVMVVAFLAYVVYTLAENKKVIDAKANTKQAETVVAVTAAKVSVGQIAQELTVLGTLAPIQEMQLLSPTQGEVLTVNFDVGTYKKRGDLMGEVDGAALRNSLSLAEAAHRKAAEDLGKLENLLKSNATTEFKVREARLGVENTKTQVEQIKLQLKDTRLLSPMSGIVTTRMIEPGSILAPGAPFAAMVNIDRLKARVKVAELDVYKLRTGQAATLTTDVYPGVTYSGSVTYISPKGDDSHNYVVEITLPNSGSHPLKAGTYVSAAFPSVGQRQVPLVPRDAIVGSLKEPKVYVAEGGVAKLKPIVVGADNGRMIEVVSGLNEGEEVVIAGQQNLKDGVKLDVRERKDLTKDAAN